MGMSNIKKDKLTPKQQAFCEEYLIDLNATQAAKRASYSDPNIGRQLITNPNVSRRIKDLKAKRSEKTGITAERVLKEYARLAFSDMRDFVSWDQGGCQLVDSKKLTEDQARCVSEVSEVISQSGITIKFKLHDKKGSLDSVAKHLGMFEGKGENPATFNIYNIVGGNNGDKSDSELDSEFEKKSAAIRSGNGKPVNRL